MPLFTAEQLQRVRDIIDKHHKVVAVAMFGSEALEGDPRLAELLEVAKRLEPGAPAIIDDAFIYAQLLANWDGDMNALMNATPETVIARLQANPAPPLTDVEKATIDTAKKHAGSYCVGLASRVASTVIGQLTGAEAAMTPARIRATIQDETAKNREMRETAGTLKSNLGHEVGNWTRDWLRIATSEANDAIQEGTALTFERDAEAAGGDGPPEVYVSKLVRGDCCVDCRRLYVGPDGEPIVFKLSELRANGSNVGRRRDAWLPVVGNTHPWCGCQLVRVSGRLKWKDGELVKKSLDVAEDHAKGVVSDKHAKHDAYLFQGLPIVVENMEGSARHWGDPHSGDHGTTWMSHDYGFIEGTIAADDEDIDCYVGPDERASTVYIVHQRKKLGPNNFGGHDEDKVFLGFSSESEARRAYLNNYDDPRFLESITTMPLSRFREVLKKNKGKRLRLIKSIERVGRLVLDRAPLDADLSKANPNDYFMNIVQGADDVPRRERPEHMEQVADAAGLTPKGRRKRERKLAAQQARDRLKRIDPSAWHGIIAGTGEHASAAHSSAAWTPAMLIEARENAARDGAKYGAHKRESAEAQDARNRGMRVSDITKELAEVKAGNNRREPMRKSWLAKSGGPFIGPKGGKWANPEHTIPWQDDKLTGAHEPKVGEQHEIHARGLHPFTAHVSAVNDDHVLVTQKAGSDYGAKMPKASVKHFMNDLRGVVDVPKTDDARVNAVIDGKAEHLGKGDDGVAFKVGDHVVKMSTTVPYQPFNAGHRSPSEAADMLESQAQTSNKLHAAGVPGFMLSEIVRSGDKAFVVRPHVDIPEKLTRAQLDSVAQSVLAAHAKGYTFNDEIQVGVLDGKLVHFDTGKVEASEGRRLKERAQDDESRLKYLFQQHGERYETTTEKEDPAFLWEELASANPAKMTEAEKKKRWAELWMHSFKLKSFVKRHPDTHGLIYSDDEIESTLARFKPQDPAPAPLRTVSADEVVENERAADSAGKQAGHDMAAAHQLARDHGEHVHVHIPLSSLESDEDVARGDGESLSDSQKKRVDEYAKRTSKAPPIRATFNERRGKRGAKTLMVANGNHRVAAARKRGETHIDAFVPKEHYERFQKAHKP